MERFQTVTRTAVVTWTPHHRTDCLASILDARLYEPSPGSRSAPAPARYLLQGARTVLFLLRRRPNVVVFQNPPSMLGALLVPMSYLLRFDLWSDTHSAPFNDPRWTRFRRLNRFLYRQCAGVIVHTPALVPNVTGEGGRALVLAYPIMSVPPVAAGARSHILVTLCYAPDEPVELILGAARAAPEVQLVLTGKAPPELVAAAPPNCRFSGWVSREAYEQLLEDARGVVCLTTRDKTMQTGGFEATERGLPLITSDFGALREFHEEGALFVTDASERDLVAALQRLWGDDGELRAAAMRQRERFLASSRAECGELRAAMGLNGSGGVRAPRLSWEPTREASRATTTASLPSRSGGASPTQQNPRRSSEDRDV